MAVAFTGSFCYVCGVMNYLEDFIHDFRVLTDKAELKIGKTQKINPRTFKADYKVKPR